MTRQKAGPCWKIGLRDRKVAAMIMDQAYEGDETRQLVLDLGMISVVEL
jgi:transposase